MEIGTQLSKKIYISYVLFIIFMILLVLAGGYVRLSGSGLSIPEWPLVNGSLLPPSSEADWVKVREEYNIDQDRLIELGRLRVSGLGSLGTIPEDMPTFKKMFLIEWSHRAIAAVLGLIALMTCVLVIIDKPVRDRTWKTITGVLLLILFQAILGGILVKSGTSTHWLFVHLSVATIIFCLIVWSFMQAADIQRTPGDFNRLRRFIKISMLVVLIQIILGALVAGSRHNAPGMIVTWPLMHGQMIPDLIWDSNMGFVSNLLDNTVLHQWLHRWFAILVCIKLIVLYKIALKTELPALTRKIFIVSAVLLGFQIILGLSNVFLNAPLAVALIHLLTAMFIMVSLSIVLYALIPADKEVLT